LKWMRLVALFGLLAAPVWAEDTPSVVVTITPRVIEPDKTVAWEQALSKPTRVGVPVVVNIDAAGLSIRVSVTPFVRGEEYLLVVQGAVRQKQEGGVRGSSTVQSLLVPAGEAIAYFPLGRNPEGERQMVVLIQVGAADVDHP